MTPAPDSPSSALELLGIVKVYGTTEVLHGVDLRVRPGSIQAMTIAPITESATCVPACNASPIAIA